ncbi:MAG TPA: ParB N-terminal domain-containing protein [Gemmatimonadaceae bacterium]
MPWETPVPDLAHVAAALDRRYPLVRGAVGNLEVGTHVPNTSSIESSLDEWVELPGVRMLPFADFPDANHIFYAANDVRRSEVLAERIRASGRIDPLIIVVDAEGPYILEGAHRFVALRRLGQTHLPALVALDTESLAVRLSPVVSTIGERPVAPASGSHNAARRPGPVRVR